MKRSLRTSMLTKVMIFLVTISFCVPATFVVAQSIKIDKHKDKGVACTSCHEKGSLNQRPPDTTCTGCHGSYAELAKKTAHLENPKAGIQNPHKSHIGEARCTVCHKNHAPSVLYCNQCHSPKFDMKVP